MTFRTTCAALLLFLTSACAHKAEISVLSASGAYDGAETAVRFQTDRPLASFENDTRPVEAVASICGHGDKYRAVGAVAGTDEARVYSAMLPGMADRAVWEPDGRVTRGWPEDLARREGVCFRLEAAEMLWSTLITNEVVLPR